MDPGVSDGWSKMVDCELKVLGKLENELKGCRVKIGEERVDGLPHKIVGKIDAGKIEEELVRNELMGSSDKGGLEDESQVFWCGSRVAGWRVDAGKMTVLMNVTSSLASGGVFGFAG